MRLFGVSFSHSENAVFFAFIPILIYLMLRSNRVRARAAQLLGISWKDLEQDYPVNRGLKSALYLVGFFMVALTAIGPQWGQKEHTVRAQGLDICFALDLSRSMLAEDLSPNRLGQAKSQLEIFLPNLGGDRAALVGFAGSAYVMAPLSVAHAARATVRAPMSPDAISDQATNLSTGVEACLSALGLDQVKDRNEILDDAAKLVVLISDGETTESDDTGAVARAEKLGVPVFAMAVGTEKGASIPQRTQDGEQKGWMKDPSTGQPVISKLETEGLKSVAEKTGGKIFYASQGVEAWRDFEKAISDFKRASRDAGTKLDLEERFQWPLWAAFLLLLWDFALTETKWSWSLRGLWSLAWILVLASGAARAASNVDPRVVRDNNRALDAFTKGDFKGTDKNLLEALGEDSDDPQLRYNWAANKLFSAVDPQDPKKTDEKAVDAAVKQLERLLQETPATDVTARRKLNYQLAQAQEFKQQNGKALEHYYASLNPKGDESGDKLQEAARGNIARLLKAEEGGGGGGGGGESQPQEGGDQNQPSKGGSGKGESQPQQGKRKPKFTGTDLDEKQAQQIFESVSGEETEVMNRKTQGEANERRIQRARDARERGESAARGKPW